MTPTRTRTLAAALLALAAAVALPPSGAAAPVAAGEAVAVATPPPVAAAPVAVGEAVTVAETTPIADILADPERHAGKTVRVEGEVRGVCTRLGCWMDIADEAGRTLRIKVEDRVLVFPADAVGRRASAQGTVSVQTLTREEWVAWQRHVAEEGGQAFDASAVGEGPFRLVQIAGTGARIGG